MVQRLQAHGLEKALLKGVIKKLRGAAELGVDLEGIRRCDQNAMCEILKKLISHFLKYDFFFSRQMQKNGTNNSQEKASCIPWWTPAKNTYIIEIRKKNSVSG